MSAGRTGIPGGCPEAAGGAATTRVTVLADRRETGRRATGITTAHHGGPPVTALTTVLIHRPAAPPKRRPLPAPPLGRPLRRAATTTPAPRGGPPQTTSPRPTIRRWTSARPRATRPVTSPRWSSPRPGRTPGTRGVRRRPRRLVARAGPGSVASATTMTTGLVRNGTSSPTSNTGPSFPLTSHCRPWRGRAGPRAVPRQTRRPTAVLVHHPATPP